MKTQFWTAGALALGLVTACAQDAPVETTTPVEIAAADTFAELVNAPFKIENGSEADLTDLIAALPDYTSISWDEKSFDPATGATTFDNLKIGFGSDTQFGLSFETAKLWEFDDSLLVARLNGERFDKSGPLFSRMEGRNVAYFGVALAFNDLFDQMLESLDEEGLEDLDFGIDVFESNAENMVLSSVSLRPWELSLLPAEIITDFDEDIPSEVVDLVHVGQHMIAVFRSLSIETAVSTGTEVTMKIRQPGAKVDGRVTVELSAAENIEGLDIGRSFNRGVSSANTTVYSDSIAPGEVVTMSGFPAGLTVAQQDAYASSSIENMKLDTVMGFLARSELPGMEVRDLLSLGTWEVADYVSKLNDQTILTAERGFFDGSGFEWIIPSDLSFGFEGATLNTGEVTEFFFTFFEAFLDERSLEEMDDEEQAQVELFREGFTKAIELMPEYGLDEIPFDVSFGSRWASDSGPTDFSMQLDMDGFGRSEFDLGLNFPTYDALLEAYQSDDREAGFERAFETAFAFRGARWLEQDTGGYDKLFGFAHALGKEYPDQGWGAMLGNMEPTQMRAYLGTIMRMAKPGAAAEFPPAEDWIEAFALYLESGGSIEVKSDPPVPISPELFERFEGETDPEIVIEAFGLTVTHTK